MKISNETRAAVLEKIAEKYGVEQRFLPMLSPKGNLVITSQEVAEIFGKSHKNVVRDIESRLKMDPTLDGIAYHMTVGKLTKPAVKEKSTAKMTLLEYLEAESKANNPVMDQSGNQGVTSNSSVVSDSKPKMLSRKKSKIYYMTSEGFMLCVMSYKGEEALKIKRVYINIFNDLLEEFVKIEALKDMSPKTSKEEFEMLVELLTSKVSLEIKNQLRFHFQNRDSVILNPPPVFN